MNFWLYLICELWGSGNNKLFCRKGILIHNEGGGAAISMLLYFQCKTNLKAQKEIITWVKLKLPLAYYPPNPLLRHQRNQLEYHNSKNLDLLTQLIIFL